MNDLWKELCEKMEEEVREKYKVEESKNSAYEGRDFSLDWRIAVQEKKYQPHKMV